MSEITPIKLTDLTGLSQPLTKLIEAVSRGIGVLYEPTQIRRKAVADANAIEIIRNAISTDSTIPIQYQSRGLIIGPAISDDFISRVAKRITFQELYKQHNIEAVVKVAINLMLEKEEVSDEPVEPDWILRFMNSVQDISDGQMQELWGKILACEVTHPGSFSFRTIEKVRNISQREAQCFQKISQFAIEGSERIVLIARSEVLRKINITHSELMLLEECGFLSTTAVEWSLTSISQSPAGVINGNGVCLFLTNSTTPIKVSLNVYAYTESGRQLYKITQTQGDEKFFIYLMSILKEEKQSANLQVKVHKLLQRDPDYFLHFEQKDLLHEYETTYQNHISYQARQALLRNGISSLYELRRLSKQTLLDFTGFGEKSYQKLVDLGYLFE